MDDGGINVSDLQVSEVFDKKCVQESLKIQLSEFEMLQSMFPNPGELLLDDYSVLAHFNNYITGKTNLIPCHLDFVISMSVDSNKLEVCVNLPTGYPNVEPDVFVRNDKLSRTQQKLLNDDLCNYISTLEKGDICICPAIGWLQENAMQYITCNAADDLQDVPESTQVGQEKFNRLWIYSHHIYSKVKRREILNSAQEYKLSGFSLPGKPGIICVEGLSHDCGEWWLKIKSMTWKKIMCKKKEEYDTDKLNINELRKFSGFNEISFEVKGRGKEYHMDFGEFYRYLVDHGCEHIFKDYFGFDGK